MPRPTATPEQALGLGREGWLRHMAQIGSDHGLFERIGNAHFGLFVEEGDTLLIAFDRADRVWRDSPDGLPDGFEMVRSRSWSLLSVMAAGETWFRDPALVRFFRALAATGLFRRYTSIVLYGAGPDCGFAACVFAQLVPGARVLAAGPVATLAAEDAPFERRFRSARRLEFGGAFGHGARALAGAAIATVLYDPTDAAEAAQAALFSGPNVIRIGLPHAGPDLPRILREGKASVPLLRLLATDGATPARIRATLKEPLRENAGTMLRRTRAALVRETPRRAAVLARHGFAATADRRLSALLAEADAACRQSEPA